MRLRLLLASAALVLTAAPSHAGSPCAGYDVTAPVVGHKTDQRCPVPLPPPFIQRVDAGHCEEVPPYGVKVCATATVYLPA